MKVPKKLVNKLSNRLGLSYHTVYNWSNYEIPESRLAEVEPVLRELEQQRIETVEVPGWLVGPLRRFMGLANGTVDHWYRHGVPESRVQEVKEAMAAMEKENKQGGNKR